MKKLLILLPVFFSFTSCTTVVDTPEPTTVTKETSTYVSPGYPATRTTTTIVE